MLVTTPASAKCIGPPADIKSAVIISHSTVGRDTTRTFARGVFARDAPSLEEWVPAENFRWVMHGSSVPWAIAFAPTEPNAS
jgi:hypothetical protein